MCEVRFLQLYFLFLQSLLLSHSLDALKTPHCEGKSKSFRNQEENILSPYREGNLYLSQNVDITTGEYRSFHENHAGGSFLIKLSRFFWSIYIFFSQRFYYKHKNLRVCVWVEEIA
jgi:hypothetical protein